jgi:hypothetical protein
MCAIAGVINRGDPALLQRMLDAAHLCAQSTTTLVVHHRRTSSGKQLQGRRLRYTSSKRDQVKHYALAVSPEIRAMVAPFAAYRALASDGARRGGPTLMRPVFVALVIGTSATICATGRATLGLVLSGTLCWSFVPAAQILAAAAIIGSATHRPVSLAKGIDLLFISHGPWSLWLLAMTAWTLTAGEDGPPIDKVLLAAILATLWTAVIVFAFSSTVLETTTRGAAVRTVVHQAMIWTVAFVYVLIETPLWQHVIKRFAP